MVSKWQNQHVSTHAAQCQSEALNQSVNTACSRTLLIPLSLLPDNLCILPPASQKDEWLLHLMLLPTVNPCANPHSPLSFSLMHN